MGVDLDMCVCARVRVCDVTKLLAVDAVSRRETERVCRPDMRPKVHLGLWFRN